MKRDDTDWEEFKLDNDDDALFIIDEDFDDDDDEMCIELID